ncbi:3',5'-cyclic AMP phosphodiesterase CpdA [Litoreibacter ponti]|uniref:3',5'-cyclic AMP phosphodiesterase CpdA n=1 Tax=Litoreibacter ponti TaxID=1510457 RepID=A0A2T6BKR5_9RHOB|nr:metallophosphoesterase [Litoreibacter ponti]PTX56657.1 3',5'-cyclic AMP phosphodiesterase CpdA [Litoreibacter ponti]
MKLLVVTDPHIVEPGGEIIDLDPSARLAGVLDHAMAHQGDADHLVILGDLTHHGRVEQYRELERILGRVTGPMTLMLGNHDVRNGFHAVFGGAGFVQEVVDLGTHRLICLDTLDEEAEPLHSGVLCDARLNWLQARLGESDLPVILALHHPCFKTGFNGMDRIRLRNEDALIQIIRDSGKVVQLLCGHVHRTISGVAHGLPFAVFKSPCHQMPMMLGAPGSSHSVDEPGAYGIVLTGPDGVVVHSVDIGLKAEATVDGHSA